MNELLEDVLRKLEKSELLIETERNNYLNKLHSQTVNYRKLLEQQSKEHIRILQNHEHHWKQILEKMQEMLTERLDMQMRKTAALQEEYMKCLKEFTESLTSLQNQLEEL